MSDEILVTNSGFAMVSGWQYYNSSRITLTGTATRYMNGHLCKAQAQIYDTIFTDNNLYMYIDYATVDNGGWSHSNNVMWEAVNGTAARSIACSTSHAGYVRWRVRWEAYGGDGKTYVDYSRDAYSVGLLRRIHLTWQHERKTTLPPRSLEFHLRVSNLAAQSRDSAQYHVRNTGNLKGERYGTFR
jgi:hypothetical protein